MPDEHWRAEIHETALLLAAVTSGDRSRVLKTLTDYLLAEQEEQTEHAADPASEHQEHYEGDQDYDETFHEGGNADLENGDYQYDPYDEYGGEDYPAEEDEDMQKEPYMSGAYNEPGAGHDAYGAESHNYDHGYDPEFEGSYDHNYDPATAENEAYETETYPRILRKATVHHPRSNHPRPRFYTEPKYVEQKYDETQYDPSANGYRDEAYDDWDPEAVTYEGQGDEHSYGGEWPQEAGYETVPDDQIQVVDDFDFNEAEQTYPDEYYLEAQDDIHDYEEALHETDPTPAGEGEQQQQQQEEEKDDEEESPLYHEIRIFPDHDYDHVPDQKDEVGSQVQPSAYRAYNPQQSSQERNPSSTSTSDQPPPYSKPQYVPLHRAPSRFRPLANVNPQRMQSRRISRKPPQGAVRTPEGQGGSSDAANGTQLGSADNDFDDAAWEDDLCKEDEGVLSPTAPGQSDLQYNPLLHQDDGSQLTMPMPQERGGSSRGTWEK